MPKLTLELRRKGGGKYFVLVAPTREIIHWWSEVPKAVAFGYGGQVFHLTADIFKRALEEQRVKVNPHYSAWDYGDFFEVSEPTLWERLKVKARNLWTKLKGIFK